MGAATISGGELFLSSLAIIGRLHAQDLDQDSKSRWLPIYPAT